MIAAMTTLAHRFMQPWPEVVGAAAR